MDKLYGPRGMPPERGWLEKNMKDPEFVELLNIEESAERFLNRFLEGSKTLGLPMDEMRSRVIAMFQDDGNFV